MKTWWWGLGVVLLASRVWALSGVANEVTVQDGTIGIVDPLAVNKGGTGVASLTDRAVIVGRGTAAVEFAAPGNAGQTLLSTGASTNPAFGALDLADADARTGTLPVGNGGTNAATLTDRAVIVGRGTATVEFAAPGNAGQVLRSTGASTNPAFGAADLADTDAVTGILPIANGGTNAMSFTASQCIRMNSGGTALESSGGACGTSFNPVVVFSTLMPITAGTTVFAGIGSGVDQTESIVQVRMPAATYTNLNCVSSADPGGSAQSLTITGRTGTCGTALTPSGTFTCAIATGSTTCTDTDTISTTANQCMTFSVVSSSTAATAAVTCSVQQSA